MAKKKAATKKSATKKAKKAKKEPKGRKLWFVGKKAKKPDAKILKKLGVRTCWLCHKHLNGAQEFEKHLSKEHETTLTEYDKIFPGQSYFVPYDQRVTSNQMYRAFMYRMVNGCWPEWFDGNQTVEIDKADPTILRAAANMLLTYQMHRIAPIMEASVIASRRMFEAADASTMSYEELWDFMGVANAHIKDATSAIRVLADVIEKTAPKEQKASGSQSVRMGFVAAGTIESGDSDEIQGRREIEQRKHHMTASLNEFTQVVQGFLQGGPENGPDVPSKVEREVAAEEVDASDSGRQASAGEEKKPPAAGADGPHKR